MNQTILDAARFLEERGVVTVWTRAGDSTPQEPGVSGWGALAPSPPVACSFGCLGLDGLPPALGVVWFPRDAPRNLTNCPDYEGTPCEAVYLHEAAHAVVGRDEARCVAFERALARRLHWGPDLIAALETYGQDSTDPDTLAGEIELFTSQGWLDASGALTDLIFSYTETRDYRV